ncbi:MAG: homocysteine S-methyltransferase family protein [Pseudomonadota bacterium]
MTITILDGSMGQELIKRGGSSPTPLWGLHVMMQNPDIVSAIHDDYFASGATIATTNTYNALRDRLANNDIEDQFEALNVMGCQLAAKARDRAGHGQVAGALGPIGASYRPDLMPSVERGAEIYEELARIQAPYVDLFIAETVASTDHARAAIMGAGTFGKPIWIAVTVADDDGTRLRSGEPVQDIIGVVAEYAPDALLVNCSTPEAVTTAMGELSGCPLPLGAYANGFRNIDAGFLAHNPTVDALTARTDLGPEAYANFAEDWIATGATIIGGCCEVGPAHIRELVRRFAK